MAGIEPGVAGVGAGTLGCCAAGCCAVGFWGLGCCATGDRRNVADVGVGAAGMDVGVGADAEFAVVAVGAGLAGDADPAIRVGLAAGAGRTVGRGSVAGAGGQICARRPTNPLSPAQARRSRLTRLGGRTAARVERPVDAGHVPGGVSPAGGVGARGAAGAPAGVAAAGLVSAAGGVGTAD
ncbi:MAG: hypothetical protein BGO26_11425 [Actinobacteria bacterium 69-20]|nr:MAG: hypothetical protein BGO26_11425 [Actinobacteria bacterium 69-20]